MSEWMTVDKEAALLVVRNSPAHFLQVQDDWTDRIYKPFVKVGKREIKNLVSGFFDPERVEGYTCLKYRLRADGSGVDWLPIASD